MEGSQAAHLGITIGMLVAEIDGLPFSRRFIIEMGETDLKRDADVGTFAVYGDRGCTAILI